MSCCNLCGNPSRHAFEHSGYRLHCCQNRECAHVFVDPVPGDDELRAIYESEDSALANADGWNLAADYQRNPHVVRNYYKRTRINWLLENASRMSDRSSAILDVGCSTGVLLRVLADMGYTQLHGMDLAASACAYVQDTHGYPCVSSLNELADETFDVIICYAVLEHTPDPVSFLQRLSRKLRPGGQLAVLVPNYESFYRRISGRSWVWLVPPIHLQYFGWKSMQQALHAAQLEPVNHETNYGGTYLYLVTYHLTRLLGKSMPSTTRTGRNGVMTKMIHAAEYSLRGALFPARVLAHALDQGNELRCVATWNANGL